MLEDEIGPRHVLLVEDDDSHAKLVLLGFAANNLTSTVERVSDGEQALAYLRRSAPYSDRPRPDFVLLDLNLPKTSGHEVLRQLKEDNDLRTIPVVILTTSSAEADRVTAYHRHANSYLTKPTPRRSGSATASIALEMRC